MSDALPAAVHNLLRTLGGVDEPPAAGARWADLGIDSLDLLELVEAAEERFAIALPDRLAARLRGPDDLVAALRALGAEPAPLSRSSGDR